ncbi:GEVED domain-containing protein [Flavobacterium xanthum]|uniref:Por secretion system C-terminal sorting domain-containing protein n=1 Tax=Flavobacterium xanthum TaxID=69322 RepID=A0A1M6WXR1_9FLAO|nr:GEVED domain-containing protein [Flavobacterium xanthum]SHK98508.1 Por secretion system C-terminal sorting domain-containing protein [Flavobacterium xanthum]
MSTSATPPAGPINQTTYPVGSTLATGYSVVDNDSNTAFYVAGLTSSTTYYFYIYSFNSLCSGGPLYLATSALTGNIKTGTVDYCVSTSTNSSRYINNVTTAGYITNITNVNTGRATNGYVDYTAIPPVTQIPNGGVTLDYKLAISRQFVKVWVDWNNDGIFTDAAPELVYTTGGILTIAGSAGFVIPSTTPPRNYRIRMRSFEASQTFGPCGNLATGETEDYSLIVVADCTVNITSVVDGNRCDSGTVVLTANGSAGTTQYRYYSARTGGVLIGTSETTSWTTPSISSNTSYYATAWNGTCESRYRTEVKAIIKPTTTITVSPSTPEVCGENNIVTIAALGDLVIDYLVNENFEGTGFGVLTRTNGVADVNSQWTNRTSPYVPSGSVWKPAITSRTIGNKFALAVSDFAAPVPKDTQIRTKVLNTTAYSDLYLSFRHYFSYYDGEELQFADVDVSTDGGIVWTNLRQYVSNQGFAGQFNDVVINVSSYAGLPSVLFRFRYQLQGSAFCDGWALDDVQVYGTRPLNTTFTWSGGTVTAFTDLACTVPYTNQSVSSIYVRPSGSQITTATWSFTATATLGNGCPISKLITIYNKTKTWQGTSNDWNNVNNWLPAGIPDISTCIVIPLTTNQSLLSTGEDGNGKNLLIKNGGKLEIQSGKTLTIKEATTVNAGGTFNIKNNSSLIQIDNVTNEGIVTMERISKPMFNLDYTYWNSPVTFASNFTLGLLSPDSTLMFSWEPTISDGPGNWKSETTSSKMDPTKGYIVKAPNSYSSSSKVSYTATFFGTPNNGDITAPIKKGKLIGTVVLDNAEDDEWNLIGNPYPSALNATTFLNLASNIDIIDGTLYLWTHNTLPANSYPDPFYGDYGLNYTDSDYAAFNKSGGTATAAASTGGSPPSGYIASGQAFFVKAATGTANNGTIQFATFNNSMRVGVEGKNGDFFKMNKNQKNEAIPKNVSDIERHRIWLNLTNNSGAFSQILVGYIEGATQGLDRSFDGESFGGNNVGFHSIIPEAQLTIQGRALPFDENDRVLLGYYSEISGKLSVRIDHLDGLFVNQNILLEDKELGIIHDLKDTPYVFQTEIGDFEERFVLRFTDKSLAINDLTNENTIIIQYTQSTKILNIANKTADNTIESVSLYDIQGKSISNWKITDKEQTNIKIQVPSISSGVYIVKLKTTKGNISKKIIIK